MSKVTVLGGGGWAIALAKVLNENGHNATLWSAPERKLILQKKEKIRLDFRELKFLRKSRLRMILKKP